MTKERPSVIPPLFEEHYPNLSDWVADGWLELGFEYNTESFIRLIDQGGMIWQGKSEYPTVDAALAEAEEAAKAWFEENG